MFGDEPQHDGHAIALGLAFDCEREVVERLMDLLHRRVQRMRRDGPIAEDAQSDAAQN